MGQCTFTFLISIVHLPAHLYAFLLLAGARMLYKNLPKTVGLRRLTLHKSASASAASSNEVTYLLLVECTHFMDHIGEAANLLPILRDEQGSHYGLNKYLPLQTPKHLQDLFLTVDINAW